MSIATTAAESSANAGLIRDDFLDPPRGGLFVHADAITIGLQASLEHRLELDGDLSMLTTRVSALASTGFADANAAADLRLTFLSFGGSIGQRRVWRSYTGLPNTRTRRIEDDKEKTFGTDTFGYAEGRARLVVPLDFLWLVTNYVVRKENAPNLYYDWFNTNVHDGGTLYRFDATLFFRSAGFGAIGPTVRYMDLPREGARKKELALGLTFGTRLGLKRNQDLLLVQLLVRPGDDEFGFHILRAPVFAMVIYRMTFGLVVPKRDL